MQLNQIFSTKKNKTKKRVGRGGKKGTYSGRGVKGQKSRAGAKIRPAWRDAIKQIPKRRGAKFKSIQTKPEIINLGLLNGYFDEQDLISVESLLKKGLISKIKGRLPRVKILGDGEITKKFNFKGLSLSENAKKKIEKKGGKIN